jgi:hypothetical protein
VGKLKKVEVMTVHSGYQRLRMLGKKRWKEMVHGYKSEVEQEE